MKNILIKFLPHGVAVGLFLIFASVFYSPLFNGYNINQSDVKQHVGMSKEIVDYRVTHDGEEPLWTNSMFGGMPAYQISVIHKNNWIYYLDQGIKLGLPRPVAILFWTMLGFYIMALCLKINPWLSAIGAIAFGFSTINILYMGAGHMSKVNAISYMAPALGGFILAYRGRILFGSALFCLFFALQVSANHLQMTYYLGFLLLAVGLSETIRFLIKKQFKEILIRSGFIIVAGILAILPSLSNLMSTQEYGKHSTRGSSELSITSDGKNTSSVTKSGLNTDYILEYNFGENEILSLAFPNVKGGKQEAIIQSKSFEEKQKSNPSFNELYSNQLEIYSKTKNQEYIYTTYHGGQKMSGGAFYFGVIMLCFAFMGLIFSKNSIKWSLFAVAILCIFLSSEDPDGINSFFIENVPMYNKFRDSKMILVLLQIIVPFLALLFLNGFIFGESEHVESSKPMKLQSNKKFILGVCSGLSEHHKLNVNLFRILFLATGFLFGVGVFMYLLMWYLLRKEKNNLPQLKFGLIGNSNWWFVSMISLVFGIVIFYLFPSITGDFWNDTDILKFADLSRYNLNLELVKFKEQVINFRIGLFKEDVLRSLLFVSLAVALLISFQKYKINHYLVLGLLLLIVSVDNIKVSQRYFNNDKVDPSVDLSAQTNVINEAIKSGLIDKTEANNYLDKYEFKELSQIPIFSPTIADIGILSQERSTIPDFESKKKEFISKMENIDFYNNGSTPKTKEILAEYAVLNLNSNYRVYRLGNAFVETQTSYYHKSIGGYHGAKLKRFQEFIDFYINTTTDTSLIKNLGNYMISENTVDLPKKYQALNMLNTKYLNINSYVQNPQDAIKNNSAYGNAWFVSSIKKVKSANDEMTGIASIDTKTEAIINVNDFDFLSKKSFSQIDPNSSIKMTKYDVNKIVYESNASKEQAAIFSEIWYPGGWNCYIDGNMTDELFRANYILRGAIIPAGKHTIEWRFEPESFKKASNYSKYGSILLFLFIFGAIGFESYKKFKGKKE